MASNFSRVKILAIFQLLHTTWCFRFFLEFHNLMLDYLMTLKNLNKNAKNLLLFMRKLEVIKNYDGWEFERCKATKKLTNFSIIYGKCYYYDKVDFTYATYARKLKLDHNSQCLKITKLFQSYVQDYIWIFVPKPYYFDFKIWDMFC